MSQKRVYFPDIDREYRNIRYTIQTEGPLGDFVKGVGEFLGGFFGGNKKAKEQEKRIRQKAKEQEARIRQLELQLQTQQAQKMPSWIWIAVIGGVLLVVLLAR